MVESPDLARRGDAPARNAASHGERSSPRSRRQASLCAPRASAHASRAHPPSRALRLAGHHRSRLACDHRSGCSHRRSFSRAAGHPWMGVMGDARDHQARRSRRAARNPRVVGVSVECAGADTRHPYQTTRLAARKRKTAAGAACPASRGDAAARSPRLQERTAEPGDRRPWRQRRYRHQEYNSAEAGSGRMGSCLALSTVHRNSDIAPYQAASRLRTACTAYVPSPRQSSAVLASGHKASPPIITQHLLYTLNVALAYKRSGKYAPSPCPSRLPLPCAPRRRHIPLRYIRDAPISVPLPPRQAGGRRLERPAPWPLED